MKQKKNIIIFLFAFSLVVLMVLQGYYIYNSYKLEEKELNRQARTIADKTLESMERYESETNEEKLVGDFQRLKENITTQKEKIVQPERLYSSEKFYNIKLEKLLRQYTADSGLEIGIKSEIYSIYDEVRKEELLPANRSLVLYQSARQLTSPLVINEGKWSSRQTRENTDLKLDEKNYYLVKSKSTFQLLNLRNLVFQKIVPLILISLAIIILILILFRNSIRNLNRQDKKITQLHTTIDAIAHELNTPITTLKFSVAQSSDVAAKALLERQIRRLERIVSSIHNYETDGILIGKNDIENYFSEIKNTFDKINFSVTINFKSNTFFLQHDFKQIMDNLIDNSSKYGADDIIISLNLGKSVEILITDNGIGIPKEEHQSIFDKYYRVARDENSNVNGLGVGLFLVKKIVDRYKGSIEVCSGKKGVSFKIILPDES